MSLIKLRYIDPQKILFFYIGLLMVFALILKFDKLNFYLIICNTLLFHII